jgi:hypothetical protein
VEEVHNQADKKGQIHPWAGFPYPEQHDPSERIF